MEKYIKWYPYSLKDVQMTTGLFVELAGKTQVLAPLYTLAHTDYTDPDSNKTYLSLRQRYLAFNDPSESAVAEVYFHDHTHWDAIVAHDVLGKYVMEWRKSLERRLQENAIDHIRTLAAEGNFAASKWLAEKSWKTTLDERLKKKAVPKNLVHERTIKEEVSEDAKRVLAFIKPRSKA